MAWFFRGKNKKKLIKSIIRNHHILDFDTSYSVTLFNHLKERFFIGVHFGHFTDGSDYLNECDFCLVSKSYELKCNENMIRMPLVSRNFTPKCFYNKNQKKHWDVLCIARNSRFKHLDLFLKSVRRLYDSDHNFKILLVCPKIKNETYNSSLMKDYYQNFSFNERENFTILRLSSEMSFKGVSYDMIVELFNLSKVFTLFSNIEGGSKVISEALCCGLPVTVLRDMKGGGLDYLDQNNSVLFDSFEDAHTSWIDAIDNYERFNGISENAIKLLGEEQSLIELKNQFHLLYEKHGQQFDGKLINTDRLNIRLPAHLNEDVPWSSGTYVTADILSDNQFSVFLKKLGVP